MNVSGPILIVDDGPHNTTSLELCLAEKGFQTSVVHTGAQAIQSVGSLKPEMIILGSTLPDMDGWDVCRHIREESMVPIMVLYDSDQPADCIHGLEMGADDCLPKPINCRELIAKINAVFRRITFARTGRGAQICIGSLMLDTTAYKVFKHNKELTLRQKEFDLLAALMSRPGQVVSRAELMDRVWGVNWLGDTRTLDVHIRWVREKIEESPSRPQYIRTVRGVGYRFAAPNDLTVR